MYIKVYNNDERSRECSRALGSLCPHFEGWLLPIPTSPDGVHLGRGEELLDSLDFAPGEVICGYEIPPAFARRERERGVVVVDSALDEAFLLENARLTALAALGYILHSSAIDDEGAVVGVVGYGRIGQYLVRILLSLGIPTRVFTSRHSVRLELGGSGVPSSDYSDSEALDRVSLLVNTAPARTVLPPPTLPVLELAQGDNFPGHDITRLSALPARHYPRAAGRAWAESIKRSLCLEVEK